MFDSRRSGTSETTIAGAWNCSAFQPPKKNLSEVKDGNSAKLLGRFFYLDSTAYNLNKEARLKPVSCIPGLADRRR
jgi:hypothetical protein